MKIVEFKNLEWIVLEENNDTTKLLLKYEFNAKYYEDLEKLKEKRSLILDYLKKTFKADIVTIDEKIDFNSTIYNLKFGYIGIGIRLENNMIINADIEYLYRYSYDLVFNELIKITKQKYVN